MLLSLLSKKYVKSCEFYKTGIYVKEHWLAVSIDKLAEIIFDTLVHIRLFMHIWMHVRWTLTISLKVDTHYTCAVRILYFENITFKNAARCYCVPKRLNNSMKNADPCEWDAFAE